MKTYNELLQNTIDNIYQLISEANRMSSDAKANGSEEAEIDADNAADELSKSLQNLESCFL